jgi:hypothetical protein
VRFLRADQRVRSNLAVTLTNGGLAGSIYSVLIASCGMIFVQLSMCRSSDLADPAADEFSGFAEMASIAPTS